MMNTSFRPAADLFSELNRLQGVLDQVFRPAHGSNIRALTGASFPVINVGTTPEAIEVMALAPGLDPSAFQLTLDRGLLIVSGERKKQLPEAGDATSVYARERFAGAFRRVVNLPEDADPAKVDATYRDGILRITVAKRESSRPRRIEVNREKEIAMTNTVQNASRERTPSQAGAAGGTPEAFIVPPGYVFENENAITLLADLPGVPKENLELKVDGDALVIEGQVMPGTPERLEPVYAEVRVPRYRRVFTLSRELDPGRIEANLKDGVLSLRIPKQEHAQPRRIQVQVG
jgi:HSP20 family protein